MDILLIYLIIRSVVHNIWTAIIIVKLFRTLRKNESHTLNNGKRLFLILPVFKEVELIEDTIKYVYGCISELDEVYLYVVGTARERNESLENPTLKLAKSVSDKFEKVKVIEDKRSTGWMAQQVNFAVETILKEGNDTSKSWMFLINIDSRFSKQGLNLVIKNIKNDVPIMLQNAVFLSNFGKINWLQKGFALWQSRWTLTHEIKRLVINNINSFYLMHVVGHGLCILLDKFIEYKMLPEDTPTEDLHFGYYLAAGGEHAKPLWVLESADSPVSLKETLRQKYTWSFGPMLYPRYFWSFRKKFPLKWKDYKIRAFALMVQGLISYLNWATVSWLLIFYIFQSFYSDSALAMAFILLYLFEYFQCCVFFYWQGQIRLLDLLLSPICIMVSGLFHSLPANIALINYFTRPLASHRFKTSHE